MIKSGDLAFEMKIDITERALHGFEPRESVNHTAMNGFHITENAVERTR